MVKLDVICPVSTCEFFLQAEDGIRGAQESRGLGDVYKRQHRHCASRRKAFNECRVALSNWSDAGRSDWRVPAPVSYTHLTLPTIYSV